PPAHVVFILATTELHKLPATIISRCQRFDFRRISTQVLMDRLAFIAQKEGVNYDSEALRVIAKMAQGGMRDAISLFELCAGTRADVTLQTVHETLGTGDRETVENTVRAIARGNYEAIFSAIYDAVSSSKDIAVFWQELVSYYRDMLVMKTTATADKYLDLTENESTQLKRSCELFTKQTLLWHCRILDEASYAMKKAGAEKRIIAEMALIKMSDAMLDPSMDAVLSRISKLENAMASGIITAPSFEVGQKNDTVISDETDNDVKTNDNSDNVQISVADASENSLKILRGWNEISEKAAAGDIMTLPFLKLARAFIDDCGKIYIRFPNDFAKNKVVESGLLSGIVAALCMQLNRTVTEKDITLGLLEGDEDVTELDDLNI
ncbi:MAG: hypothetical protein IJV87_03440, partial [Clostridia bacterium]|nr:hypothetical protein [Clostridia bacterium]